MGLLESGGYVALLFSLQNPFLFSGERVQYIDIAPRVTTLGKNNKNMVVVLLYLKVACVLHTGVPRLLTQGAVLYHPHKGHAS